MTTDITLTGTAANAAKTQQQAVKLTDDFSDFLTLLTTQLQNQDPLAPMDSTEFTNQLVQFSQVEQSINTNQKLDDLLSLQLASISSVALGYVGLDATYTSSEMNWDGEKPININYALTADARIAKINIYDESGALIRTLDSPTSTGAHKVVWDGTDDDGNTVQAGTYSVKVDAADTADKPMTVATAVSGTVRGIESQNGVIYLLIGERAIALNTVIQATKPAAELPAQTEEAA